VNFPAIRSRIVAILQRDIDTDQIIPARFLKTVSREGLGAYLFADWRAAADGKPRDDFVLNQPQAHGAQLLLAGPNFGCGSSREHAVWALKDWGIRAVIAPSFADIFRQNALKNALLPVRVESDAVEEINKAHCSSPDEPFTVSLDGQTVAWRGAKPVRFVIDPFSRKLLLEGIDEFEYLLRHEGAIARFEARRNGKSGRIRP
jgi:3-isopropylmalate/(R)-2-methylmalate dehydratase small subunit